MNDLKTVSEIAGEIGCSSQAVYSKIKRLESSLKPFKVKQGNCTLYTSEGRKMIISAFSQPVKDFKAVDNELETLSSELESLREENEKLKLENAELKGKNETLNQLTSTFKVNQAEIESLLKTIESLTAALTAAQTLHGMEKQQKMLESEAVITADIETEKPPGLFKRIFKRKKGS